MVNVRPLSSYRHLDPSPDESLMQIAYSSTATTPAGASRTAMAPARGMRPTSSYAGDVLEKVRRWRADDRRGGLSVGHEGADRLVFDERHGVGARVRPCGWQSAAHDACERPATLAALTRLPSLARRGNNRLADSLSACKARHIMVRVGDSFLGLAVITPARTRRPAAALESAEAAA
jgi:hypothetical protein